MTETPEGPQKDPEPQKEKSELERLRDEFIEQFVILKASFEASNKEKDDKIKELSDHNKELERALIRSAQTTQLEPTPEKTQEELYTEQVSKLAERTLTMMKEGI